MTEAVWIFLAGQGVLVVGTIVFAAYHFGTKLSKIETSISFIEKNCPRCKD